MNASFANKIKCCCSLRRIQSDTRGVKPLMAPSWLARTPKHA